MEMIVADPFDKTPNTKFIIEGYHDNNPTFRQKLISLGFVPGVTFSVVRQAPLGDPVEINILGTHVALREKDAKMLSLRKLK